MFFTAASTRKPGAALISIALLGGVGGCGPADPKSLDPYPKETLDKVAEIKTMAEYDQLLGPPTETEEKTVNNKKIVRKQWLRGHSVVEAEFGEDGKAYKSMHGTR